MHHSLYQSQLKRCVTSSLVRSSADVRQIVDNISAVTDTSSLGTSIVTILCVLADTRLAVRWRCGVAVERWIRDREVAGSSLGRALWRKNSGQVSHTYD